MNVGKRVNHLKIRRSDQSPGHVNTSTSNISLGALSASSPAPQKPNVMVTGLDSTRDFMRKLRHGPSYLTQLAVHDKHCGRVGMHQKQIHHIYIYISNVIP